MPARKNDDTTDEPTTDELVARAEPVPSDLDTVAVYDAKTGRAYFTTKGIADKLVEKGSHTAEKPKK